MVKFEKYSRDSISQISQYFSVFTNTINILQYFTLFYKKTFRNISCKCFRWYFTIFYMICIDFLCTVFWVLFLDIFDYVSKCITWCLPLIFTKLLCVLFCGLFSHISQCFQIYFQKFIFKIFHKYYCEIVSRYFTIFYDSFWIFLNIVIFPWSRHQTIVHQVFAELPDIGIENFKILSMLFNY